jgi:hypothetical protein
MLIPQIEDSIRAVLIAHGIVPSSFYDSGVQDEYNLNKVLTNPNSPNPLNAFSVKTSSSNFAGF